jgi:hypothetical protein
MYVGVQEGLLFFFYCNQFWNENCASLGCFAASSGNSLLAFRDHLSVLFQGSAKFSSTSRGKPEATQNWNVSKDYNKPIQYRFSGKFIQLLHADIGRTDRNDDFDGRFSQLLCEDTYTLFSISQRRCFSITKVSHLMLVLHVFFLSFFFILGTLKYILLSE